MKHQYMFWLSVTRNSITNLKNQQKQQQHQHQKQQPNQQQQQYMQQQNWITKQQQQENKTSIVPTRLHWKPVISLTCQCSPPPPACAARTLRPWPEPRSCPWPGSSGRTCWTPPWRNTRGQAEGISWQCRCSRQRQTSPGCSTSRSGPQACPWD